MFMLLEERGIVQIVTDNLFSLIFLNLWGPEEGNYYYSNPKDKTFKKKKNIFNKHSSV